MEVVNDKCGLSLPTDIPPSPVIKKPPPPPMCVSGDIYTVKEGDTCDSIALEKSIASAALFTAISEKINGCAKLPVGAELCLPLTCEKQYTLQKADNCTYIERVKEVGRGRLRKYNNWINMECTNLHSGSEIRGNILCLGPQAGTYTPTGAGPGVTPGPAPSTGYTGRIIDPPANSTVPVDTTKRCGKWYTVAEGDTCAGVCVSQGIPAHLFWAVNPSLSTTDCNPSLLVGVTYCVGPVQNWDREPSTTTTSPPQTSTPVS